MTFKNNFHTFLTFILFILLTSLLGILGFSLLSTPSYAQTQNTWTLHRRGANDLDFYYMNGGTANQPGLRLIQSGSEIQARKFSDLDNPAGGFLDPAGSSTINNLTVTGSLTVGGSQSFTGDISANVFRDAQDPTNYYMDPNGTSNLKIVNAASGTFSGALTVNGGFTTNYVHTTLNDNWFPYPGDSTNYIRGATVFNNIMYDEANRGYYIDIGGNTRLKNAYFDATLINWPGYNGITQATGNYIYPGRYDGSSDFQQSWFLASHASYGLYTNTGMRMEGTFHAPSWKDINDPTYGVDPNGYSTFWVVRRKYGYNDKEWDENGGDFYVDPGAESHFNVMKISYFYDLQNAGYYLDLDNTSQFYVLNAVGGNTVTSDIRLKKDVTTLTNSLDKVLKLRGVNYYYKQDTDLGKMPTEKQVGLIAQETESVVPEVVTTTNNGYKAIDYGKLNGVIVEAIKEQQAQIKTLKDTTSRQEQEIEQLKKTVELMQSQLAQSKK